jgi:hypothetical protein
MLTSSNQRSFREGNAEGSSGFIAWRCDRMNLDKSNREEDGEKRVGQRPRGASEL